MENKFNYEGIKESYTKLTEIWGTDGGEDSIAGIFKSIDKEYKDKVNSGTDNVALYGNILGGAMLDYWDSVTPNFELFINNFANWSETIAYIYENFDEFDTSQNIIDSVSDIYK